MSFLNDLPQELQNKITKITTILPDSLEIFQELYQFGVKQGVQRNGSINQGSPTKRRKLEGAETTDSSDNNSGSTTISQDNIIFQLKDVSVLSPLRKKLNLVLHMSENDKKTPLLSLQKDDTIELNISDLRTNIKMATFLPVPEKPNLIYLFIKYINTTKISHDRKIYSDPILITLTKDTVLQQFHIFGILAITVTDFTPCIDYMRKQAILTGFRISNPFANTNNNGTITNDNMRSFYVNCHRGTKEGTLYFLPDNILFGFRKPILLFDANDIESITYSSITRLTFNVTLITKNDEKFEFSMIDQSEYTKIDEYVKRKQVIDKSMSEELKAKTKNKSNSTENSTGENEDTSVLEEVTKQMNQEGDTDLNGAVFDSEDDAENDVDFEAESDLSDGSDDENENEDSEDLEANEENDEHEDVGEEEDTDEGVDDNDDDEEIEHPKMTQQIDVSLNTTNSLADIPIEVEDDENEDEDEGSGVEY